MIKNYIEVKRTARYFQSKEMDNDVKHILFVLHGYAQNADRFLKSFETINSSELLIVAPEGLSKFYWKDFSSNPVSSWMTSLERENEIKDSVNYLLKVEQEVLSILNSNNISFHVLGFSQGAAMASRYVANSSISFKNLFLYAGSFAHDLDWDKMCLRQRDMFWCFIFGNQDVMFSEIQLNSVFNFVKTKTEDVSLVEFNGKHRIVDEALLSIQNRILK